MLGGHSRCCSQAFSGPSCQTGEIRSVQGRFGAAAVASSRCFAALLCQTSFLLTWVILVSRHVHSDTNRPRGSRPAFDLRLLPLCVLASLPLENSTCGDSGAISLNVLSCHLSSHAAYGACFCIILPLLFLLRTGDMVALALGHYSFQCGGSQRTSAAPGPSETVETVGFS